ncbi:MAG: hypothetical protein K2X77_25310 [Candidatus Obscuribacterales bacterium]|jgi:hypothetical protein|nr:hypothetical protein [Candidatus Obscuribacterales bacterium]
MHRLVSVIALLACVSQYSIGAANAWENSGRIEKSACEADSRENSGRSEKATCETASWENFGRNIPLYVAQKDCESIVLQATHGVARGIGESNEIIAQYQQQFPQQGAQYQQQGVQFQQPATQQFQQQGGQQYQQQGAPQFQQQGVPQFQQQAVPQFQQKAGQPMPPQFSNGPQQQYPTQMMAPNMVPGGATQNPPNAPGFVNLNTGRFGKLDFNILGGRFQDSSVDNLHVTASDLDMARGQLGGIDVQVTGGHFREFTIDQLRIVSSGALMFSPEAFLNNRVLEFTQPISANVVVVFTQKSLNQFLSSPASLQMLSSGATNHLGGFLSQIVGSALQVKFQSAAVQLMPEDRIQTDVNVLVNLMNVETAVPLSLSTRLLLQEGWISMADTRILTSGQELPPEMSSMIVSRLNKLADWGKNNPDLRFSFNQLKVYPGDRFELGGTAFIQRLRFGN